MKPPLSLYRSVLAVLTGLAVLIGLATTVAAASVPAGAQATANPKPQTIPALQEWTGGTGSFSYTSATRIVRSSTNATTLATTSQVFADDLKSLTGQAPAQTTGTTADLRAGDIYLALGSTDTQLGTEGYALSATDKITITARDDRGAFYGTRTILQLLKQSTSIPQGTARDWPLKPERGLMVDVGRKYFTPQWLRDHVKELAYLKMNYFHLHLSDSQGFRIESSSHPEIVSYEHLTKKEIQDLIALAAKYKVTIVPEIDAPGHLRHVMNVHPELQLVTNTGTPQPDYIDLSKPAAYTFMKELYEEYLALFPGPYFHIGADEYRVGAYSQYPQLLQYAKDHYGANATGEDVYLGFINWANDIVRSKGKTTRAWNDGVGGGTAVTVNPNIILEFWFNIGLTPQKHIDNGHLISNDSWNPTYYVVGTGGPGAVGSQWGYDTWDPDLFQGNQTITDASDSKNLGSKIHVWMDRDTATQERVAADIKDGLRMLAQRTWGSPKLLTPWSSFKTLITTIDRNPAWPANAQLGNIAAGRPVTVSSTETGSLAGANAVDSNYGTRWSSGYSDNQSITVDLGIPKPVSRVKLTWQNAYGKGYQIQVSNDATNWTTVYTTTTGDGGTDELTGLSGTGRYVRMQGTARATSYGYSLYEFEVYAPVIQSGAAYQLTTGGKAMDIPTTNTDGTQATMYSPHTGNNQKFVITANSNNTYSLKSVSSGLCLSAVTSNGDEGQAIIQTACNSSANQKWSLWQAPTGYNFVSSVNSQLITASAATNGAKVIAKHDFGQSLQAWTFTKV
ncbi:family 20 glycosylhydrolase [Streptomyces sp. ZAF1911]|uniref:family 20 glycosylhydrolase n=1 Tax=Streptomyces sp. ZAF1911 TaxID=2944129 RepID=UPI00237A7975|nr:family 20 glycosylhydrolase [Streptomyces sp. ZAF1911]MDD9375959.1 family 20 glycosylhydrolase [Streptomyces sp. ZAF1911]